MDTISILTAATFLTKFNGLTKALRWAATTVAQVFNGVIRTDLTKEAPKKENNYPKILKIFLAISYIM